MKKIVFLLNMTIAFFLYPFVKYKFRGRNIWLTGGSAGELYVDNGKAMFEYLNEIEDIESYWVINKNSSARKQVNGKILDRGSIKSYLYFMNSKAVLFSHSISADIVPYLFAVPLINRFHYKTVKVFLNHGTVALKKRQPMNPKLEKMVERLIISYDINPADAEYEKNIKHIYWKIDNNKIYITGNSRYDTLDNKSEGKKIFFMPTWRPWIKNDKTTIEETDYFQNITGLVKNKELQDFLKENNIVMNIYIHQLMHEYLGNFGAEVNGENIRLLPKDADIQNEIVTGSMLITDYSSMAFDFYYLDKPVLFFQFDREQYEEKAGSYIDLEKDLFGESVFNIDECVVKIRELYSDNFQIPDKYKQLRSRYFRYTDKNNRERLYEIIKKEVDKNR
ncbi:CDP-glycerol glycerophosphotransferase family protein [Sebaldella sp. S0638]|uniref:CDP-glycerol glycerophosphotransferase family protein n=1 Tax=Sebaldella sp. S0638 TaxID=2957809 RepID=UPI0020A23377|nr:CDP-glycerol glycerophosphotransferase family protein [Sebaldella sp. S0638]MCP1223408.1 CDP-glycerol glycerophosphotransferase family protein [Sebaldella sp. S0638]